jgi:hypothetical protein
VIDRKARAPRSPESANSELALLYLSTSTSLPHSEYNLALSFILDCFLNATADGNGEQKKREKEREERARLQRTQGSSAREPCDRSLARGSYKPRRPVAAVLA